MNSFVGAMSIVIHAWHGHTTASERQRWLRTLSRMFLFGVALYIVFSNSAWAATSPPVGGHQADFSLFDSLDTDAKTRSNTWFSSMLSLVRPTFLILATIEICWAAAIWALERDNLNSLAVEIIKKIMFFGFFFALLQYAPSWVPTIAASFQQIGETASGTGPITTDTIIATGLALIKMVWSHAPTGLFGVLGKLGEILVACFVTLGIIIAYVVLAAQYFTLKVESYILFAAGAVFIGLGSSSWTKDYVSKYLNYAINVGVRLLVLILVLSLLLSTVSSMGSSFSFNFEPLLKLLAVAILQAILGIKAPEMAGALLNGGIGLSAGSAAGAASSGIGGLKSTMGMATGALGMAAAAAVKGVVTGQGAANIGRAVAAGRELAKQDGKSGAAATLSGLGAATAQAAKLAPGKLMDAIKGKGSRHRAAGGGGHGRGANPGLFDLTNQKMQSRVAAGAGAAGGSDSSSKSTKDSSTEKSDDDATTKSAKTDSDKSDNAKTDSPKDAKSSESAKSTDGSNKPAGSENGTTDADTSKVDASSAKSDSRGASTSEPTAEKSNQTSAERPKKRRKGSVPNFLRRLSRDSTSKSTKAQ